jgi:3'-phosphoadenosine 5'-phosphosulfate (PAPS) 3'-phosphatase
LISDDDGGSSAMSRAANPDVGCLYFAHKGRGAFSAPLADPTAPFTRIHVKDVSDASEAQFMESFESRHSDQSFAARVARSVGVVKAPLRMDSQVKYGILSRGEAARYGNRGRRGEAFCRLNLFCLA